MAPRRWAVVVFVLLVLVEAYLVFWRTVGVPATSIDQRDIIVLSASSQALSLNQTFRFGASGLCGISLYFDVAHAAPGDEVTLELRDAGENGVRWGRDFEFVLRHAVVPASAIHDRKRFRWGFEPLKQSSGRWFRLLVYAPSGVGVLASRTRSLRDAGLYIGAEPAWGELAFETSAKSDTVAKQILNKIRREPSRVVPVLAFGALILAVHLAFLRILLFVVSGGLPPDLQ